MVIMATAHFIYPFSLDRQLRDIKRRFDTRGESSVW